MKRRPLTGLLIEQLTTDAAAIARAEIASAEAVCGVAHQANLTLVRNSEMVLLYRSAGGAFVSAWREGPHGTHIGLGGAGFNHRIDWAE